MLESILMYFILIIRNAVDLICVKFWICSQL